MAERHTPGLQRVLGVNALFATAYGNVGSSIYYALGLVASFALGLTPIVFVIAGGIFYLTAATYAEATAMYPEAGGSSSFARHAFNEFWSFFAAWGQMLNYVITVAISAFFVPHYIGGLFWAYLKTSPGDIIVGIAVIVVLCAINIVGVKEAAGVNVVLAFTDFSTQLALVILGCVLVLSPETLVNNVHLGTVPTWKNFIIAIPVAMIAYTGIETISNMAEEAKDEVHTIPKAIKGVVAAVFAIYALMPAVALSALPVTCNAAGKCQTLLGLPESQGGYAGDPVLGIVKHLNLGPFQHAGEIYVGLLAATILFIATNAGIIGVSRLVYSMGLHRQVPEQLRQLHPKYRTPWIGIIVFGGIACLTLIPGQAVFLGNMYAFGAMLSFTIAHISVIRLRIKYPDAERPYRGPGTLRVAGYAAAAVRRPGRDRHGLCVGDGDLPAPERRCRRNRLAAGRRVRVHRLPPQPGPRPHHDHEDRAAEGRSRHRGRIRVGAGRLRRARLRARRDGNRGANGGAPTARDPHPGHDLGSLEQPDQRPPAGAGGARPVDHRRGQGAGRAPGVGSLGQGQARSDRSPDRRRGARHACRGDRDADGPRRIRVRTGAGDGAAGAAVPGDRRVSSGGGSWPPSRTGVALRPCNAS